MYIKNAEHFLRNLGFIGDENSQDENGRLCEYYLKINKNLQLFAVSTDINDIMFISEHRLLEENDKEFEVDENNIEILSEHVYKDQFENILKKYNLIKDWFKLQIILKKTF